MRHLRHPAVFLAFALVVFATACATTKRATYNTLSSLESSTTAAMDTYLSEVGRGRIPTNDVPKVSKAYNQFQDGMQAAVELAQFNWETFAPSNVVHLGTVVVKAIAEAKAR